MEIRLYHDSYKIQYRSVFGAVPSSSSLTIRLGITGMEKIEGGCQVVLRTWQTETGEQLLPMEFEGDSCVVTFSMPAKGGLLWYYFIVKYNGQTVYYGNNKDQLGGIGATYDQEPPSYQITIYDKDVTTPDWFKHAIVYQIFPDRFCRDESITAELSGKKGAVLHSYWYDKPHYCKAADGSILQYDFFGGNLEGIRQKLDYLAGLGVTAVYLNPVFESCSNHRYDTADYHKIDPFLGNNDEFADLCEEARDKGIRLILDGVFSHTGEDSLYFNKLGNYPTVGAYQSKESPYYEWYRFTDYPDEYESWWGVKDLPNVEETTPSYMDFIINNDDSVLKYWLAQGIGGWRLDVIDELPETFLKRFYKVLKETNPDAILIGEVWEDASNKVSYDEQRSYLSGYDIDSAMNYALRAIMLDFILGRKDGNRAGWEIRHLVENYPKENLYAMLNIIGSHDVERIYTILCGDGNGGRDADREYAAARLKLLVAWQMTMPGAPCIYYGDEAGVEGDVDPDNRRTYPWGKENKELLCWYKKLTKIRQDNAALQTGRFIPLYSDGDVYVYCRCIEGGKDVFGKPAEDGFFVVALNRNPVSSRTISVYTEGLAYGGLLDIFEPRRVPVHTVNSRFTIMLPPLTPVILHGCEARKQKRAGVLLHPSSLPSPYGVGDLGDEAFRFIDFLAEGQQKIWQILPLTPTGPGNSPYVSASAFAGNERLISLEKLLGCGWLDRDMYEEYSKLMKAAGTVEETWQWKKQCLFEMSKDKKLRIEWKPYDDFCRNNVYWLKDYCLFSAVRDFFGDLSWTDWPEDIRSRQPAAMRHYKKELAATYDTYSFLQYIFYLQWQDIRKYAHEQDITILGDVPIFVAHESADCWAHQELFQLDEAGHPEFCAGVPPDYFSINGQLWGNPLYRWDVMAEDNYDWWVKRFRNMRELVDEVRIDHFRGFAAYWSVKAGSDTAKEGRWIPGPGEEFFRILYKQLRGLHFVAEDLGIITDDVCELKDRLGLPGMKVMHFHMKERDDGMLSFDTEPNCVAYTGTHDNNTTLGWYMDELDSLQQQRVRAAAGLPADATPQEVVYALIAYLYSRRAETVIVPMQDLLCLPGSCRMNYPGIAEGNWQWQMKEPVKPELAKKLAALCEKYNRG